MGTLVTISGTLVKNNDMWYNIGTMPRLPRTKQKEGLWTNCRVCGVKYFAHRSNSKYCKPYHRLVAYLIRHGKRREYHNS